MYYLIIFISISISILILFAIIFVNRIKFVNWLKSINLFNSKNINKSKSDMVPLSCDKKYNYNCESPDDFIENIVDVKVTKKASCDINTNFEPRQQIVKTKSLDILFRPHNEKIMSYSHTYANLSRLIPNNTPSKFILEELIKNKNNNIMSCCNPYCRAKIYIPIHFAFDGYYCNEHCRNFVYQNIYIYWKQLHEN